MATNTIILLNADYSFLNFINVRKALKLMAKEKIEIVKYSAKEIRTITGSIKIPGVVRLINLIQSVYNRRVLYTKNNIYLRDKHTCTYCGQRFDKSHLTIDHIIPKCNGGKDSYMNCITSCKECNAKKGKKSVEEFGRTMHFKPYIPSLYDLIILRLKNNGNYDLIKNIMK